MIDGKRIGVVIPTRNEADALPKVLRAIPAYVDAIAVGDYDSTDGTVDIARHHGALVAHVTASGYGRACLEALALLPPVEIVVFLDGDAADDVSAMTELLKPILTGTADFTLGSRVLGQAEPWALTPQQIVGNALACFLMRLLWRRRFTDLGPFRAICREALNRLEMADLNYGWTVEMQVKAARIGLRTVEIPVNYRRRIGVSKVSGTLTGAVRAGCKILWVIGREALRPSPIRG
jgi:glycosyltransferase involved in cell wall biosynthesis